MVRLFTVEANKTQPNVDLVVLRVIAVTRAHCKLRLWHLHFHNGTSHFHILTNLSSPSPRKAAHQAGEDEVCLSTMGRTYTIDFNAMQQINEDTGTARPVQRQPNPACSASSGIRCFFFALYWTLAVKRSSVVNGGFNIKNVMFCRHGFGTKFEVLFPFMKI